MIPPFLYSHVQIWKKFPLLLMMMIMWTTLLLVWALHNHHKNFGCVCVCLLPPFVNTVSKIFFFKKKWISQFFLSCKQVNSAENREGTFKIIYLYYFEFSHFDSSLDIYKKSWCTFLINFLPTFIQGDQFDIAQF